MITDIVMPQGNEEGFYEVALTLGYSHLILVYAQQPKKICEPPKEITVTIASLGQKKQWATLGISNATANSRGLLEHPQIDGVYGLEQSGTKEFIHHRGSGLNQVLARIGSQKSKKVIFALTSLLSPGLLRGQTIGRMTQNIRICTRFKTLMSIASLSRTPYSMASPQDLQTLFCTIGMHPMQAKQAMNPDIWKNVFV